MMRRLAGFVVGPVFLIVMFVLVLVLLGLVVNELRSSRPAEVHLKKGVVGENAAERKGDVQRTDKFVFIKPEGGGDEEVYTWDQVLYISDKIPSSRRTDRIVDLIDLLSKLGIAATVIFFMVGLHQYSQTQKWEREKFLANTVKELLDEKQNRNAMAMIDSLALYEKGRMVELFPYKDDANERRVFVKNSEIYEALTTTPRDDQIESDRAIAIRECFDTFLSYMGTFDHYIEQDLITQDALSSHLGYWIDLLGPKGDLSSSYKSRIFAYATKYGMTEFEDLIRKYNRRSLLDRLLG